MAAIETERKKPVFAHGGHMYRFDRRSADDGKFWRCLVDGCNGRIKTDANDVFIEFRNTSHTHQPDPDGVAVNGVVTTMRRRAEREATSIGDIYGQETAALASHPSTAAVMPSFVEVSAKVFVCMM